MNASSSLFRREAIEHRSDRLHGSVNIAMPVAWQTIGLLLLAGLSISIFFLAGATYSRIETVTGTVALDKGVPSIVTSRQGVIADIFVGEGQRVRAGTPLLRVRSAEDMIGGATAPDRIRAALADQDRGLASQADLMLRAADADRSRLKEQILGHASELGSIEQQMIDQRTLVESARRDFDEVRVVAEKGFISRRDLESREATLLARRQQLSQLEQLRSTKRAEMAEARRAILQGAASAQAQAASAQAERAALSQRLAETDLAGGYVVTSPVDGVVTALTAKPGQPVAADQVAMMVVPVRSRLRAELLVPTAAAGFLSRGQEVRLAIDAFPYQRFGTVGARVGSVSTAASVRQASGGQVPVYLVTAELLQTGVRAFGRRQPLLPGMTLVARIATEKRSLLEWLFEPLYAVRNR